MSSPGASAPDGALVRVEWQAVVFAERPRRIDLLRLRPAWPLRPLRIRVHRNQPFEFVASALATFVAYAGYRASFEYGPYDDALAGLDGERLSAPADVEIVWLDYGRYEAHSRPAELAAWLGGRVAALRRASAAPILVADSHDAADAALNAALAGSLASLPGVHLVAQSGVAAGLGAAYVDERASTFAASTMSDAAAIETARCFGLMWVPAILEPRLKAIVVDLDNTLYRGVLGEDGPAAASLEPGHRRLQERLRELREAGLFLAIASRNDPADVAALFATRDDFPLRRDDFSAVFASWEPKARSIAAAAAALHVGPDAVLFVDDNPGELAQVAAEMADVRPLLAADALQAERGLRWHPGLFAFAVGREDALRAADVASETARAALAAGAADPAAYLGSLGVELTFRLNPREQLTRMHELSTKTNQFNTGFLRLSEAAVAGRLDDAGSFLVTAALRDRLSDSGVVGLVVGRLPGQAGAPFLVEEVAISCRALGRGVEDLIVATAIRGARDALASVPPGDVEFSFRPGPRNAPAAAWLESIAGTALAGNAVRAGWTTLEAATERLASLVTIRWEEA